MSGRIRARRRAARIAVVQALYQMEVTGRGWRDAAREFDESWFREPECLGPAGAVDGDFFRHLLEGAVVFQKRSDRIASERLKEGWTLSRLDPVLRALFRAALFELLAPEEAPAPIVLSEYTDIAADFFGKGREIGLVNALLQAAARERESA